MYGKSGKWSGNETNFLRETTDNPHEPPVTMCEPEIACPLIRKPDVYCAMPCGVRLADFDAPVSFLDNDFPRLAVNHKAFFDSRRASPSLSVLPGFTMPAKPPLVLAQ